jgi:hypothetical protein
MNRIYSIAFLILCMGVTAFAQLDLPRESQRQEIMQVVGDGKITVVYHRPNTKGRKVWGNLVKYGEVWRAGANENTTIEFTRDVTINGKPLPAGKYGFHTIPGEKEWTLIFNKVNDAWGSFTYKQENDALRVATVPVNLSTSRETLAYEFDNVTANSADVSLSWEKVEVPFTVSFGDVHGRMLAQINEAIKNRKADDVRPLNQGAGYVLTYQLKDRYSDALGWLDTSLAAKQNFGTMVAKARLLEQMGRTADAIAAGEAAITFGKAQTPPAQTGDIERFVAEWKAKK